MAFHRCTISAEDGSVVCEDVTVTIEETEGDGASAWYGTVTVTHRVPLTPGRRYRMVLGDGRAGEFVVRRNTFAGETSRAVAIHGIGQLK